MGEIMMLKILVGLVVALYGLVIFVESRSNKK